MDNCHRYELGVPFMRYTEYERKGPDDGVCKKCGNKWQIKDEVIVYCQTERPFFLRDEYTGKKIGVVIDEILKMEEWKFGVLIDFEVCNPAFRDTSYDQNLADYDIWEEVDPVGYRPVDKNDVLIEGDTLSLFIIFFFHRRCIE